HFDRLVEGLADAELLHARAQLGDELPRDALLHQEARAGAADLPLIEPDRVDDALDHAVEIGVFKNDERAFPAKLEREFLARPRRRLPDLPSDFRGSGERDLVDVRMIDEKFPSAPVTGDDVEDAGWQSRLVCQLREAERRERREFRGL